jgi:hypothetical protein
MEFTLAKAISTHLTHASAMQSSNTSTRIFHQGEEFMKRSIRHTRKFAELPIAWREAEYAALRTNAADTCDDRVSEDIFDVEDERTEVEIILHRMIHDAN